MSMLRELYDAIFRVVFGHNTVDNTHDWHEAHNKAKASRVEIEKIIRESQESQ